MRHSPTRLARDKAKLVLQGQIIDLINHTIDVVRQSIALCRDAFMKSNEPQGTLDALGLAGNRKAPSLECLQQIKMCLKRCLLMGPAQDLTQAIGKKTQRPLRCNVGVELSNGTGCCIAWIDKGFFSFGAFCNFLKLAFIQRIKIIAAHIDLTAHLQDLWQALHSCRNLKWNLSNGFDVVRHIFAIFAIAARCRLDQQTFFITQAHGQAIKLELGHIANFRIGFGQSQFSSHACIEGAGTT